MPELTVVTRITATPAAREAIYRLRAVRGGPVMFVQSGGGSRAWYIPTRFPMGEFLIGGIDVLLGDIDGCPFYIDKRLDQAWHQERFLLDVAVGEPEDFSLGSRGQPSLRHPLPRVRLPGRTQLTHPFLHL